jgi:hypothetical protein
VHSTAVSNAVAESFFHTLKVELIHAERFPTRELMRQTVVVDGVIPRLFAAAWEGAARDNGRLR